MKKILLIEDDNITTSIVEFILKRYKYEVIICTDGLVGMNTIDSLLPDLVITDLMLPNKSGIEIIKHSKNLHPDIPIIIMSVFANQTELIDRFLNIKADGVLSKKFTPHEILEMVEKNIK